MGFPAECCVVMGLSCSTLCWHGVFLALCAGMEFLAAVCAGMGLPAAVCAGMGLRAAVCAGMGFSCSIVCWHRFPAETCAETTLGGDYLQHIVLAWRLPPALCAGLGVSCSALLASCAGMCFPAAEHGRPKVRRTGCIYAYCDICTTHLT